MGSTSPLDGTASPARRPAARVLVVSDSAALGHDSRAHRVARAAAAAGYDVTLVGRADDSPPPALPGVTVRRVEVPGTLAGHRAARPRPGLRWPLAYRSAETHRHRTARLAVRDRTLRTREAELAVRYRPLSRQAVARAIHAAARLGHAVRGAWTRLRAAQYEAAVRRRLTPTGALDDVVTAFVRLTARRRAWRRLDPSLLDLEAAYGPVLDACRPHLIHARGRRSLGVAVRAAVRAEAAGRTVRVIWDATDCSALTPAATRRAAAARESDERAHAEEADAVVTACAAYGDHLAARLRPARPPLVVLNAPAHADTPVHAHASAPVARARSAASAVRATASAARVTTSAGATASVRAASSARATASARAVTAARAASSARAAASARVPAGTVAPAAVPTVAACGGVRAACGLGPDVPLLVHSGGVAPERGLLTAVEALPKLYDLHAAFVVPDPGDERVRDLVDRAGELGVAARLHVLPYTTPEDVPAFLASADIGVVPVHHLPHHEVTLATRYLEYAHVATRYLEYAHARLPVVVSDVRAMAAATLATGNGEVFRAADTADFVRAVGAVLTNPPRYRRAYERSGVLRQWCWQTQAAPLLALYAGLLDEIGHRA
ncbi:glycosyltransferase [Streptomyces sp. PTM05]|uniref:D-inositol 3-phosphate glycosyltransferase n=1 Tax=Streptantibioticus parmotrematis TaxID=2873249 RepID=A0ABS7QL75_9ACTN|nr:glycosyltransferase [Streptantibioticus parmotrematis]MBY8883942.1 glycosyltransferase [Streptantibioticus parmotrematis]